MYCYHAFVVSLTCTFTAFFSKQQQTGMALYCYKAIPAMLSKQS